MEESAVPPPEPTVAYKAAPHRPWRRLLRAALPLAAVAIVVIIGILLANPGGKSSSSSGSAHLLTDETTQSKLVMSNASGKQLYSLSYPKFDYLNFEASSPKGEVLLSQGLSTASESYTFIVNGKTKSLPNGAVKALSSAIVLDNAHHVFFTDENNVIYVTCPNGANCKLMSVNLSSGQTATIATIGSKAAIPQLPVVYPLGLSADKKTVYIRTLADNKLGKTAAAVYAVNMSGRVTGNWPLPLDADYTPSLSPDGKQIVYKTLGTNNSVVTITDLNLETGKTYTANWTKGAMVDRANAFAWSPDSQKVYFWGSNGLLPSPNPNNSKDINTAYLTISNTKLTDLQTIKDSAHNQIVNQDWLDNSDVVYELDTSKEANSFVNPTPQIYKQNINSKAVVKFTNLSGKLKQVVYY